MTPPCSCDTSVSGELSLHRWVKATSFLWRGVTSGGEAKTTRWERGRPFIEESSLALAGLTPYRHTSANYNSACPQSGLVAGATAPTNEAEQGNRECMTCHPFSGTEPLASPRPRLTLALASPTWLTRPDVPEWDAALAAPGEVAALTPTHCLYLFLLPFLFFLLFFVASLNKRISSQPFLLQWSFDFHFYQCFNTVWLWHISHLLCQIAGSLS